MPSRAIVPPRALSFLLGGGALLVSGVALAQPGALDALSKEPTQTIVESYQAGRLSYDRRDFRDAVAKWRSLLEQLPDSAVVLRARLNLALSTAYEQWDRSNPDQERRDEARRLLLVYAELADRAYALQPALLLREQRRVSDRLVRLDGPLRLELAPIPAVLAEQPGRNPSPPPPPDLRPRDGNASKHMIMMIGGAVVLGMGIVATGLAADASVKNNGPATIVWAVLGVGLSSTGIIVGYFGLRRWQLSVAGAPTEPPAAFVTFGGALL